MDKHTIKIEANVVVYYDGKKEIKRFTARDDSKESLDEAKMKADIFIEAFQLGYSTGYDEGRRNSHYYEG